jgi:phosphatidylserine/phosphatidylglycerophosphate/cardiolipin synthase-like enzyme
MSMRVIAYVPIFKLKADYIVRQGRTWSAFEHMVLWKLAQQRATSPELAELAGVPLRLVVECLIELIGAGWVDIHTSSNVVAFEATDAGKKASELKKLPEDTRILRRRTILCMDRLAMGFFKPEDLTLVHKDKLPENAVVLKPRIFKLTMKPGASIDRLYMREDETFEEWVEHRITSQRLYAAVQIFGDKIEGLPLYTPPALFNAILEDVIARVPPTEGAVLDEQLTRAEGRLETEDDYSVADVNSEDLVIGGQQHFDMLARVIAEAKTFAVIHTCFVGPSAVRRLLPLMEAAVAKRNVHFDLLWGQRSDSMNEKSRKDFQESKAIFDKLPPQTRSRIRFAERETGSHAKVILADSGPHGSKEAYVGSCNWLSSLYRSVEVSIRLREPRVVGTIAATLAWLRIPSSGKWTADVYRLAELRNECFKSERRREGTHRVAVVRDREHLAAVREARDSATSQIFAACDLLGPAGETSVFVPARAAAEGGVSVTLIHNTLARSVTTEERDRAAAALSELGIHLLSANNIHGKFMTWDEDALLITSFNWLATTPDPWKPLGAEIGIIVRGPGLAEKLRTQFCQLAGIELSSADIHRRVSVTTE